MKTRDQVNEKDTWDLTLIYKNENEIELDKKMVSDLVKQLITYKNNVTKNCDNLLNVLELEQQLSKKMYKIYMYFHLKLDQDLGNSYNQNEMSKISSLLSKYGSQLSFISPEILSATNLDELINDEKLKDYKRNLEVLKNSSKYVLSEIEEKIMSNSSQLQAIPSKIYSVFTNSELKFESVVDKDTNVVEVTEANYSQAIRSTDRDLRKNFFKSLLNGYKKYNKTISAIFNSELQTKEFQVESRNYKDYITKSLFDNEVKIEVYDNLIDVVSENLQTNYDYLEYRRKKLGVEKLHLYDTYVPIISDVDKKYSYEEACEICINSLEVLGEEYVNVIKESISNRWIDIYPNEGKRGGAYSSGSYETVPYILLNYTQGLDDVFTLTHELGHSMHTYFTNKTQNVQDSHYKIFVAEIASTVNELLLMDYMYNTSNNDELKKYLLNYNLDQFRTTVIRQTMFAEFEKEVNNKFYEEKSLESNYLNEAYYGLNKKYFGNDVVIDEEIKYEWSRIPHFYYDFYVYQYATCFCIATYVSEKIINNEDNMKHRYLEFLKSGDSTDPINIVSTLGIDITKKDPLELALNKYKEQLNKLIKLGEK